MAAARSSRWSIAISSGSGPTPRPMPDASMVAGRTSCANSPNTPTVISDREKDMSEFVIYSIPGSPFGRAVFAALEEKGAAYSLVPVAPGSFRSPEHLARHPFGRVPVLDHGGFRLYETQAILRYLDRILPGIALSPADPKVAARMDQLMNICDWYLFQGVCNVIGFQRIVGPRLLGLTPDEAAIAGAM